MCLDGRYDGGAIPRLPARCSVSGPPWSLSRYPRRLSLSNERYHAIITTSVCVNRLAGRLEENTGKCAGGVSGNSWREIRMEWIHRTLTTSVLLSYRQHIREWCRPAGSM